MDVDSNRKHICISVDSLQLETIQQLFCFFHNGWEFLIDQDNGGKITHIPLTKSTQTDPVPTVVENNDKNETFRIQQDSDYGGKLIALLHTLEIQL